MINIYISSLLLLFSAIFIAFGIIGIHKYKDVYSKLLTSSQIDTVAAITTITALIIRTGFSQSSVKLLLILLFIMLTGPVSNHIIARSAYMFGYNPKKEAQRK